MYHRNLETWKKAIELVIDIYAETKLYPDEERFGLTSQIRRAAVSIPSNIAEGAARTSDKDMLRFIDIALGSLAELDTQLVIADRLNYLQNTNLFEQISRVTALVSGVKKYLTQKATS